MFARWERANSTLGGLGDFEWLTLPAPGGQTRHSPPGTSRVVQFARQEPTALAGSAVPGDHRNAPAPRQRSRHEPEPTPPTLASDTPPQEYY